MHFKQRSKQKRELMWRRLSLHGCSANKKKLQQSLEEPSGGSTSKLSGRGGTARRSVKTEVAPEETQPYREESNAAKATLQQLDFGVSHATQETVPQESDSVNADNGTETDSKKNQFQFRMLLLSGRTLRRPMQPKIREAYKSHDGHNTPLINVCRNKREAKALGLLDDHGKSSFSTRILILSLRMTVPVFHSFGLPFFGHVMRREKLEKLVTTGILEGKRSRGKQREKLIEGLADWLKAGKSLEAIEATKDRKKWRTMIANAVKQGT
ncbi:hypothetical protein PoB_004702900 [Plakobranchus ocellatus]|uniref:Uncharacterized protein n=1 Tax=Plakobranchus ocellatus TaxID=259542 RepID=A0AAV4BK58_9GAST|nr:hypothetical protein PoB_004702900 [Plakobranchus ocellatus]